MSSFVDPLDLVEGANREVSQHTGTACAGKLGTVPSGLGYTFTVRSDAK